MRAQRFALVTLTTLAVIWPDAKASLLFVPTFDSSITGNANSANIEGAINTAISTIEELYGNSVTVPVTFTYNPASPGNLESTHELFYHVSYRTYVGLLQTDSAANPGNTVLATALANLSSGNDASGSAEMSIAGTQLAMLGILVDPANAVININSIQNFGFTQPVSGQFDAVGGIEHELDEVLGGGGSGSTMNNCVTNPTFFCGTYGSLDLYRYSAPGVASFTTSGSASSYFSINAGLTSIVAFNQNSNGDYADFFPACGLSPGGGQYIQNAFNCLGPDEAYTTRSAEFTMLESIGWDPAPQNTSPEPGTLGLLCASLVTLAFIRTRRQK
jgi:hypothetical protein